MRIGPEMINCWSFELNSTFTGKKVTDVTGRDDWIILTLGNRDNVFLTWSSRNAGCCHINSIEYEFLLLSGNYTSNISAYLKKHLQNAIFIKAEQIGRDRIIKLYFEKRVSAGVKVYTNIILEAVGPKSNLVISDQKDRILESAKHIHPYMNSYRTIAPDHNYIPPPPFKGISLESFGLAPTLKDVSSIKGIGKDLSKLVLENSNIRKLEEWADLLADIYSKPFLCLPQRNEVMLTVFPEVLPNCEKVHGSFLEAGKFAVIEPLIEAKTNQIKSKIRNLYEKQIKSRKRHLDGLLSKKERSREAENFRKKGDLLMSSIYQLSRGQESVLLPDYENNGENVEIILNPRLSPSENIQKYYNQYKKYKKNLKGIDKKIFFLESRIDELSEQKETIELVDHPVQLLSIAKELNLMSTLEIKKKQDKSYLPPHLKKFLGEFIILVGLNAKGNRYVTFNEAGPEDIWFHAYEVPGSHVILKLPGKKELDKGSLDSAIETAASLAAYYSKYRNSGKVRVIYTRKKNVRPIKGGGIAQVTYYYPDSLYVEPDFWKESCAEN